MTSTSSAETNSTTPPSSLGSTEAALRQLDGKISLWTGIPFGIQHVLAMFVANLAPIAIVVAAAQLTAEQSAWIISSALLVAGLGTCLQLYPLWRIGGRLPIVTGISFTYVAAATLVASDPKLGYGAVIGAVIVGGFVELLLGLTAQYWKPFINPIVSAVVVTTIGFSLLSVGATSFGGGSGAKDFGSWQNLTVATITLVACLAFQVLTRGIAKQLSVLFGLVVGYIIALIFTLSGIAPHMVDFSNFQGLSIVSLPHIAPLMPFGIKFDVNAIVSFTLLYVVSSVEVLGNTSSLTQVGFNREPTDRETAGAIAGDGFISSIAGFFGALPLTSFAQNVGLVAITRVVNRKVILTGGLILILASFFPCLATVFNSLPQAVLGGCTIMMFGSIVLAGIQMIAKAGFTQRNITIVTLALTIGIGFTQAQGIFQYFPALFQSVFSNAIAIAFVVALILSWVLPDEKHFLSE
ncbi:nucleobase:cation symporter-2 family protein [Alloscardovia omnicolens]|uniref:uracil-xanthine permease family protein n=1 Tax=Alloscardovia omnicolens TaxID=419015 RepID=UPI00254E8FD7|nr:nucleobase:cation symporter-2 family protein [Alloscardovia omnicolens]MDK6249012.1 nucleobase:cation symporter-2 family protein [Alloscardovia omnicolens]MDK6521809.1 nucleobase:cation symporter-2 family protein [Alloscardovia omnicolens]MDK8074241.1 nucleobase:cation symporter-2 family protein [Alloscardovia omnicolens]MDK8649388.1 nucleobase:cation symporter-2 family protein [Alloscardovia omnicolens]